MEEMREGGAKMELYNVPLSGSCGPNLIKFHACRLLLRVYLKPTSIDHIIKLSLYTIVFTSVLSFSQ